MESRWKSRFSLLSTFYFSLFTLLSAQPVERVLYVSALNGSGRPVAGLSPQDVLVRENDTARNVLRVSPVAEPFDIAILVDTSDAARPVIGEFRAALREFFRAMGDRHQIAVMTFGQRPAVVVSYTNDPARLQNALGRVTSRSGSGAYLMEAIVEASRDLRRRENPRRAAIVIATESTELGEDRAREVVGSVLSSELVLNAFVVPVTAGVRSADESPAPRVDATSIPAFPDQRAAERAASLDEAAELTGGRLEHLGGSNVLSARLRELASEFNNQYRVVYEGTWPTANSRRSIEVRATQSDVRIKATWMPTH